jgi:hypothetical protein
VLGWRRNHRSGAPAPAPAVQPPVRPRDEWRTLPPLPTVLRSPVTTAAVDAFSANLGTWRNPSFLSPLGHHVDPDGPAGLITSLVSASPSPEPVTYYRDRPLPPAGGVPASLQRSVASWPPAPPTRSWLMTAPEVDLGPAPLHAVSTGTARPEMTSTDQGIVTNQEPETPGMPTEPPASPAALSETPVATAAVPAHPDQTSAASPTTPGDRPETSRPSQPPLLPDRGSGSRPAQRQITGNPPLAPQRRRLGLGAPLSDLPGSPARTVQVPDRPVVARSAGTSAARGAGRGAPQQPVPPEPGNGPGQERPAAVSGEPPAGPAGWPTGPAEASAPARAATEPVQPATADQAEPDDPRPHGPMPAEAATPAEKPPAEKPPAEAPLIGDLQPELHTFTTSITQPAFIPPRTAPVVAETPLAATTPPLTSGTDATVQRSVAAPGASPATHQIRSPAPAARPPSPADAGLTPTSLSPDRRPADQPGLPPPGPLASAQRLPSDVPIAHVPPPNVKVAPLLGHRQPPHILSIPASARTGPQPVQASTTPDAPARRPVSPAPRRGVIPGAETVVAQRSVHARPPAGRSDGSAAVVARGAAADHREQPAGFVDPGAIAVARGLARPDPDGSVVFDLSPAPTAPDPSPFAPARQDMPSGWPAAARPPQTVQRQEAGEPVVFDLRPAPALPDPSPFRPARQDMPSGWPTAARPPQTVQRQEAGEPAGAAAPSPGSELDTAAVPAPAAASAPSAATAPAGAASPPLDELARQLFGPLTARLKAELRLDRERAGLLTDLRQ